MSTSTTATVDRLQYGYDRDGNVLYEKNLVNGAFSELYHANSSTSGDSNTAYDSLNRLTTFRRVTLTSSGNNGSTLDTITTGNLNSTTSVPNQNSWSLDALGNWTSSTPGGSSESNSFNSKNEETTYNSGTSITYDNNGNMLTDELGNHYTYDAWNHAVYITNSSSTAVMANHYDALGNMAQENLENGNGNVDCYYNTQGNSIQESVGGAVFSQEVWGLAYVNDIILRDQNSDFNSSTGSLGKSGSGMEVREYAQHDKQFSTISLTARTGSVLERMIYDPYGAVTVLSSSWAYSSSGSDGSNEWAYYFQGMRLLASPSQNLYQTPGRLYDITLGRWGAQDPAGYVDSPNLFEYVKSNPTKMTDPSGRDSTAPLPGLVPGGPLNWGGKYSSAARHALCSSNYPAQSSKDNQALQR